MKNQIKNKLTIALTAFALTATALGEVSIAPETFDVCTAPSVYLRSTPSTAKMFLGGLDDIHVEDPTEYSINLSWIKKKLNADDSTIFPEDKTEEFINNACSWAHKNPESVVNIWYDGFLTSAESVSRTQALINEQCIRFESPMAPIYLRNIHSLPIIHNHADVFDADNLPIYTRSDLARIMIGYEILLRNETDCYVYADMDMPPLSKEELLDEPTLHNLSHFGFVMESTQPLLLMESIDKVHDYNPEQAETTPLPFDFYYTWRTMENGFQIFTKRVPEFLQAIDFILLNKMIPMLRSQFKIYDEEIDTFVYDIITPAIFEKFLELKSWDSIRLKTQYFYPLKFVINEHHNIYSIRLHRWAYEHMNVEHSR
jgi:hypothetical protein